MDPRLVAWAADDAVPSKRCLPHQDAGHWRKVVAAYSGGTPGNADQFESAVRQYHENKVGGFQSFQVLLREYPETSEFFSKILPLIVTVALQLPAVTEEEFGPPPRPLCEYANNCYREQNEEHKAALLHPSDPEYPGLPILRYGADPPVLSLSRKFVLCLVANMFLCTFTHKWMAGRAALPFPHFVTLLGSQVSSEVAKLRMFINFFERQCPIFEQLRGFVSIRRVRRTAVSMAHWQGSTRKLVAVDVMDKGVKIESEHGHGCLHADFANAMIGGGVLGRGTVQEEIRFSVAPEHLLTLLVCTNMRDDEAIQVVGCETFSTYTGYKSSLRYDGNLADFTPRTADGTVLSALAAMDALDFRKVLGHQDASQELQVQLSSPLLLRELNKAACAFAADDERLSRMPVATGNWGAGIFKGSPELKGMLQWAAASQAGRPMKYFPFDMDMHGDWDMVTLAARSCGATVGDLLSALVMLQRDGRLPDPTLSVMGNVAKLLGSVGMDEGDCWIDMPSSAVTSCRTIECSGPGYRFRPGWFSERVQYLVCCKRRLRRQPLTSLLQLVHSTRNLSIAGCVALLALVALYIFIPRQGQGTPSAFSFVVLALALLYGCRLTYQMCVGNGRVQPEDEVGLVGRETPVVFGHSQG
mmetsp:Transcript_54360/g.123758  ORF Transcript_54360/g.123758 Transcript_54360/m.123758 type:complete len:642 (+) Transcript_54360:42-1967(+)